MSELRIREATAEDARLILDFIIELAVYEKARQEVVTDEQGIRDSLFCDNPKAFALICELNNKPVGYAVYFFNYSTWLGKYGIYLEDVYVTPEYRGRGCGKALLKHVAGIALEKDCGRFEWSVLDWNTPSIEFYEALGAKPQSEWIIYRTTGEALKKLGSE
jgi:GNAT superfamily N-acetyltransferase